MKSLIKFSLFLAFGLGILYLVYQNQEAAFQLECACQPSKCEFDSLFAKVVHDFKQANLGILALVCLGFLLSAYSRALRWNILLEPMGYKPRALNGFFAIMTGYLFNLALPRAGEITKPALFSSYEKIPLDKLMGTIVVDRIFDVIMLLAVIILAFLLQFPALYEFLFGEGRPAIVCENEMLLPASDGGGGKAWLLWLGGAFLLLSLLAALWLYSKRQVIKGTALYQKLRQMAVNFSEGIRSVFKLKQPKMFVFHTLFIWFMYFLMTYICFFAYEPTAHLGAMAALLAFVFGGFGILIPSPGGMGTYQIAVTAALVIYQVPDADAFSFSNIIFFTVNIFCAIFFGLLSYVVLPLYNRGYKPEFVDEQPLQKD